MKQESYEKFGSTGLLVFVNIFLNIFGWALSFVENDKKEILGIVPVRVKTRGFTEETNSIAYQQVTQLMGEEAFTLYKQVFSPQEEIDAQEEGSGSTNQEETRKTTEKEDPNPNSSGDTKEEGKKE